jgi:hypothetical protein
MRSRVAALGALVLAASLPLAAVTPAEAGVFGLKDEIKSYEWSPRTGSVSVRVVAECPKRMWRAEVGIELTQKRVTASDRARVKCDGEQRTIVLRLDPKQGRFHPGAVDAWYTTGECVSDFCGYVELKLEDVRIPPPGRSAR